MTYTTSTQDKHVSAEPHFSHVLVVDDEPEIRKMVSICLQKNNCKVTTAESSDEACKLLVLQQFDAVVSDIMMPGEDGIAFLGRVHESWPELPVIMMTGHAQLQMAVNAIKNGAFDFVHKPFDFDYLRKIVNRAINYSNLQRMEKNYKAELEQTVATRTAELKKSLAELDFARAALQKASSEKSAFMSTISHEMRTPMNGVIGSIELLTGENLTGAAAEYLAMAKQSADSMMTLINQLLTFNTLNAINGTSQLSELTDLTELIDTMLVNFRTDFARKGLEFSINQAGGLPKQIWTDREKLLRLMEILLNNALKFTERGSVEVSVSRIKADSDEEMLLFEVTDSGVGIPTGMLDKIFEPFVQGDSSYSRRHEGVGLGLAIARQNAMLLNGNVWAEHVPTGGSRFVVTLKLITP